MAAAAPHPARPSPHSSSDHVDQRQQVVRPTGGRDGVSESGAMEMVGSETTAADDGDMSWPGWVSIMAVSCRLGTKGIVVRALSGWPGRNGGGMPAALDGCFCSSTGACWSAANSRHMYSLSSRASTPLISASCLLAKCLKQYSAPLNSFEQSVQRHLSSAFCSM